MKDHEFSTYSTSFYSRKIYLRLDFAQFSQELLTFRLFQGIKSVYFEIVPGVLILFIYCIFILSYSFELVNIYNV